MIIHIISLLQKKKQQHCTRIWTKGQFHQQQWYLYIVNQWVKVFTERTIKPWNVKTAIAIACTIDIPIVEFMCGTEQMQK